MCGFSQATRNICQLGSVFFFNFFSFFTLSALSQTIVESVAEEKGINRHAGYYSAFLTYLVFTFGHFVATPIVEIITPKWSIVSGLVGYAMFEAAFLWMNEYFLYFSAACAGFSGSLLWTGQFDYLAQNSQPHTLDRNSSNLWGLSQTSLIFGGAYLLILYRFQTGNEFEMPLIRLVVGSFFICTLVSIAIGLFLPQPAFKVEKYKIAYFKHLSEIVKISFDRNLMLLFFMFLYTGLELSFFSAVFPTMVSFTKSLGNTRDLNAISSIFVGIGNVSGCFALSVLGSRVREFGRKKMVLLGSILHMTCFLLTFLMFPDESPLKPTEALGYILPSPYIILVCGFLLGVGDTIFNQQCYTILSDIYDHDKRIEAFAVYRFYQSAASCVAMFYSAHALLRTHVIILSMFCVIATATFFGVRVPEKYLVNPSAEMLEVKECEQQEKLMI
ncbi:UNC93-like protein MFSD11 [Caenorhabditis elegans]|uniref:UNC93-like protein MFSD11 n=1 Tax=Caenorhabditis elegans TaxID=6239 RepID=Q17824_CAEEL|nr:UNC93-like protein MFSD11 [Caenorhabditis elegans]CCD63655.1 UNC93-like protein MFSD11 [Caenorhabditis elegans]|eukprot:NP_505152.2 Uncharacterized protein CELE_C08D8.1 [Caenorhabditis elegans]